MLRLIAAFAFLNGHLASSLKILESSLSPGDSGFSGAKLSAPNDLLNLTDITICLRFNLFMLGRSGVGKSRILTVADPRVASGTEPIYELITVYITYPTAYFTFGQPVKSDSYLSSGILEEDRLEEPRIFIPETWHHLCFSYRRKDGFIRVVKDGKRTKVNGPDSLVANVNIDPDILDKVTLGMCPEVEDILPQCTAKEAKFTDFNIWSNFLSEDELLDWTGCRSQAKGNIVNWDTSEWKKSNMALKEVDYKTVCGLSNDKTHEFLSKPLDYFSAQHLCHRLKGEMSVVRDQTTQDELSAIASEIGDSLFWIGYDDIEEEGVFREVNSKKILGDFQPFWYGEPNGDRAENCLIAYTDRKKWNDRDCDGKSPTFCHVRLPLRLSLRGLKSESNFDDRFVWTGTMVNGRQSFKGFINSLIHWSDKRWKLSILGQNYDKRYGFLESDDLPLGLHEWSVRDNDQAILMKLSLHPCTNSEFNCEDGACVSIEDRCNGKVDCKDGSDEKECSIVEGTDMAALPPPPTDNSKRFAEVKVDIELLAILDILEVKGLLALQIGITLTWIDPRLWFYNLKERANLNVIGEEALIWMPEFYFVNTIDRQGSDSGSQGHVRIQRRGNHTMSERSDPYNQHIYSGHDNPIISYGVYSTQFLCTFNIDPYPFDEQLCNIELALEDTLTEQVTLILGELEYMGPKKLPQYYVKEVSYVQDKNGKVVAQIRLGRRLLSVILTTYVPSILITIVSFSTTYFSKRHFEASVAVNLTCMLVLTTLFIGISSSLPRTAAIKYVDLWLIATLAIPFLEVINNAIEQGLLGNDEVEVGPPYGEIRDKKRKKMVLLKWLKLADYCMPILFVIFTIVYMVYGFNLQ